MKRLLLLVVVVGCVHHAESASSGHEGAQVSVEQRGNEQTVVTRTEDPDKSTTVTEEFQYVPAENDFAPDAGSDDDAGVPAAAVKRLVRRTVRTETTGKVTEETHQELTVAAQSQETLDAERQATAASGSKPSIGCAMAGWMYVVAVGVAVCGIIYGALKLRRAAV